MGSGTGYCDSRAGKPRQFLKGLPLTRPGETAVRLALLICTAVGRAADKMRMQDFFGSSMILEIFLDACFHRHDVIPAKAGIQSFHKTD